MFDELRNLLPDDDLQWFGMRILTPKIRTFWVFEGGGNENGAWSTD